MLTKQKLNLALTGVLLLDQGLEGHGLPGGGLVDGHLLKLLVGHVGQDAPDVLVNLQALQQCRFATEEMCM